MGREATTDFVLDTKGHCFLCMDLVSSPLTKLAASDPPDRTSTYTVHYLSKFLKLDMRKVFKDRTSIPPQLLAKVQTSKLRTDLCEECLKLSEQFSELHMKLEKVRLEVDFCLSEIHQKLRNANARKKGETVKFETVPCREPNFAADLLKLEIAEVLRREAANQCTTILSCPFPRIKVHNMTKEQIGSGILKITSKSSGVGNKTAFNSSFESPNEGLHDMGVEMNKVKLERNSPNLAVDTEDSGDWNELGDYATVAGDDYNDEVEPEQKYEESTQTNISQHPGSSSRTLRLGKLHIEGKISLRDGTVKKNGNSFSGVIPPPIKIPGKMGTWQDQYIKSEDTGKCRCRLCPKSYTTATNFFQHYKSIHAKQKFKCGLCGIEYPYKQVYEVHYLSVHAGVRFQCGKCNSSFARKKSLYQHNKSAHLGRRINCKVCSMSFTESFNMKAHMRKFHGDQLDSHTPAK